MALNAVSKLLEKHVPDPYSIGRVEVGTESNVDMAKSIKSYIMDLFPSNHVNIEGVDNINACYGGMAALINTVSWCKLTGGFGIVVATDTADMDLHDSGWRGAAAVAMLVGPDPFVELQPERTSCFKNTHDFLKPRFATQTSPFIETKESMNHYIEALDTCIRSMKESYAIDTKRFDAFVFHGGLCATFMKLVERHLMQINGSPPHWKANFEYARFFASQMGGLYTASVFVNLLSLLDGHWKHNQTRGGVGKMKLNEIGIFAYGSGSTATLIRATVHHDRWPQEEIVDLRSKLQKRKLVPFDTLSTIVRSHETHDGAYILRKQKDIFYRELNHQSAKSLRRIYRKHASGTKQTARMSVAEQDSSSTLSYQQVNVPPTISLRNEPSSVRATTPASSVRRASTPASSVRQGGSIQSSSKTARGRRVPSQKVHLRLYEKGVRKQREKNNMRG